jgi:hypothetical protein
MRARVAWVCVIAVGALACGDVTNSSSGDTSAGGSGGGGGGAGGGGGNRPSFTVTFDPLTVEPGVEDTQCVVKRVGNDEAIRVHQIHNVLPEGSHHLIVYRTADTVEQLEPFACEPFSDTLDPEKGSPVMITQKHDETLTLPDGVGFTFEPGAMVRLEMHYINTSGAALDVSATSTFVTMTDEEFHDEASFLFVGNPDIQIPPGASQTLGPTFMALPQNLSGVSFFGITGHTHQWGTNVTVAAADGEDGPDTPVYDVPDWQWSEPATVIHDPPFQLPDGGGFRFTCEWTNMSAQSVGFGESANAEMCFFWAYYYPSEGAFVCAHTDQVPGGLDLCCPGSPFCSQLF